MSAHRCHRPRRVRGGRGRVAGQRVVAIVCFAVIGLALLAALFGPLLAPHDPNASNLNNSFVGPGPGHCSASTGRVATCSSRCSRARARRWLGRRSSSWRVDDGRHRGGGRRGMDAAAGSTTRSQRRSTCCSRFRRSCWPILSRRRVRAEPGGSVARARGRLHAVHRAGAARRGAARARTRVRRRARGPRGHGGSRSVHGIWYRTCSA